MARTIIDVARHSRRDGIMSADAALHESLVTRRELADALRRGTGWRGVRQAREITAFASALAESPLESLTRRAVNDSGLPPPELQVVIIDADQNVRYRVDMLWRER